MELSVIVPVYNMASDGLLEFCINSLVNQTVKDMEIIAVDDCSSDNSFEILKGFEEKYPGRVKAILSPENRRQGGARNLGLKEAQGRFIGFMDADDWASPDMFEKMLKKADETGADAVGTDFCKVSSQTFVKAERIPCNDESQTGVLDDEKRKKYLLNPGPVVTKIYKREIFFDKEFSFPENISYEDNATTLELGMRIKQFEYVPEANYFYYQRGDSTTHGISIKKCEDRLAAMRIMLDYAKKHGAFEKYHDVVEYQYGNLFYRNTLFTYMQGKMKKDPKFVKALSDEILSVFPNFKNNPYFVNAVNDYEMKLINLQLKNTNLFMFVYALKQISKKIRTKKK